MHPTYLPQLLQLVVHLCHLLVLYALLFSLCGVARALAIDRCPPARQPGSRTTSAHAALLAPLGSFELRAFGSLSPFVIFEEREK